MKKAFMIILIVTLAINADAADFSRYQVILESNLFGQSAAAKKVATEIIVPRNHTTFLKNIKLSAITETTSGVRVGIIDTGVRPPAAHYLSVGDETPDGIIVLSADYARERVLLKKNNEEGWIGMTGLMTAGGYTGAVVASRSNSSIPMSRPAPRRGGTVKFQGLTKAEYARTRHERPVPVSAISALDDVLYGPVQIEFTSGEERKAATRKYNMDLIRTGGAAGPILPVALTVEEDQQLVDEGVLPPL